MGAAIEAAQDDGGGARPVARGRVHQRGEDALQRDVEIERQVRLHIVMRLAVPVGPRAGGRADRLTLLW